MEQARRLTGTATTAGNDPVRLTNRGTARAATCSGAWRARSLILLVLVIGMVPGRAAAQQPSERVVKAVAELCVDGAQVVDVMEEVPESDHGPLSTELVLALDDRLKCASAKEALQALGAAKQTSSVAYEWLVERSENRGRFTQKGFPTLIDAARIHSAALTVGEESSGAVPREHAQWSVTIDWVSRVLERSEAPGEEPSELGRYKRGIIETIRKDGLFAQALVEPLMRQVMSTRHTTMREEAARALRATELNELQLERLQRYFFLRQSDPPPNADVRAEVSTLLAQQFDVSRSDKLEDFFATRLRDGSSDEKLALVKTIAASGKNNIPVLEFDTAELYTNLAILVDDSTLGKWPREALGRLPEEPTRKHLTEQLAASLQGNYCSMREVHWVDHLAARGWDMSRLAPDVARTLSPARPFCKVAMAKALAHNTKKIPAVATAINKNVADLPQDARAWLAIASVWQEETLVPQMYRVAETDSTTQADADLLDYYEPLLLSRHADKSASVASLLRPRQKPAASAVQAAAAKALKSSLSLGEAEKNDLDRWLAKLPLPGEKTRVVNHLHATADPTLPEVLDEPPLKPGADPNTATLSATTPKPQDAPRPAVEPPSTLIGKARKLIEEEYASAKAWFGGRDAWEQVGILGVVGTFLGGLLLFIRPRALHDLDCYLFRDEDAVLPLVGFRFKTIRKNALARLFFDHPRVLRACARHWHPTQLPEEFFPEITTPAQPALRGATPPALLPKLWPLRGETRSPKLSELPRRLNGGLFVHGDAGTGKSRLGQWLVVRACGLLKERTFGGAVGLPVCVPLKEDGQASDDWFHETVARALQNYKGRAAKLPPEFVRSMLKHGTVVPLFELSDTGHSARDWLAQYLESPNGGIGRFYAACRQRLDVGNLVKYYELIGIDCDAPLSDRIHEDLVRTDRTTPLFVYQVWREIQQLSSAPNPFEALSLYVGFVLRDLEAAQQEALRQGLRECAQAFAAGDGRIAANWEELATVLNGSEVATTLSEPGSIRDALLVCDAQAGVGFRFVELATVLSKERDELPAGDKKKIEVWGNDEAARKNYQSVWDAAPSGAVDTMSAGLYDGAHV